MLLQRQSNGQIINLSDHSHSGGAGRIYPVPSEPSLVAKVYHNPTIERARKLSVMLANPPDNPTANLNFTSIAWPVDLLYSTDGKREVVGFLMPYMGTMSPIIEFYNPGVRRQRCPGFNYYYLHHAARNLAASLRAIHARGYVIGDINESNILINDSALVAMIDTDSFQVQDPDSGAVYRCPVGKPEFTPPELQNVHFASVDRRPEHDLFGLAVLIFQLLMEGFHPFAGNYERSGDPPPYEGRISAGHFPYCAGDGKSHIPRLRLPRPLR